MMKLIHLAAIAILPSTIANHVLAKELIEEPSVQPKNFRSANQGIGSLSLQSDLSLRWETRRCGSRRSATVSRAPPIFPNRRQSQRVQRSLNGKMHSLTARSAFAAGAETAPIIGVDTARRSSDAKGACRTSANGGEKSG